MAFAGLRAVADSQGQPAGQINAIQTNAAGDIYLLLNQGDGVRVIQTDPTASTVLATAYIGAKFDVGLAMALDPAGNVYVTGTTDSGSLTATGGVAFPSAAGTATNSFVAKFAPGLGAPLFVTFCGSGFMDASSIAATADAVFITVTIYSATLPVTPAGIIQTPAYGSQWNGFVEKFSASSASLLYATYLSGASGSTSPVAIAADSADDAYIAGTTTSPGYPTIAALVPNQLATTALGSTSGFLTKLTPQGDGIAFSTFIPGAGIASLAIDAATNNLLLSGSVSLGQFPIASVSTPLAATSYQVLLRMTLDGQTVVGSTVLAPGTQSFVAAGASGTAWVDGSFVAGMPLLPLTPLSTIGNSFAVRVNSANLVDQAARFGGIATSNPNNASAPVNLTSVAVDPSGDALFGGGFAPSASQGLLATEAFDLPLNDAPTAAFPSTVRGAVLPVSACNGSLCAGAAAYLSKLALPATVPSATASLALSVDDSPNLTLRNLGSAQATGVQIAVIGGFTSNSNCGATLPAGGECSIALSGAGPGSIAVSAVNSTAQTQALPALAVGVAALPVVFSPKELDFGIVSSASGAVTRTITVTNLTQQSQIFASSLDIGSKTALPYTFAQTATDCTSSGSNLMLAPGGICHIAIGLTASNAATNDGPIQQNWLIGTRDVQMTAYAQAAALSLSAPEIDFGTQYTGGLRPARYLYLSNNSTESLPHSTVTLPTASPFTVADNCPATLEPQTVCQLQLAYRNAHTPSADTDTLSLDQGLAALLTGQSLPQPAANGASSVNPNLGVSATSLNFANAVVVTGVSSETHTLTIQNTGNASFALSLALSGDFTDTTSCGVTLAANSSCTVVFTFVPSQPGTRQGLLAISAGTGFAPTYVALSGVGTGIVSPANNGSLNFGGVIAGQPSVQWYKIAQPFTRFAVATASSTLGAPYTAILVEDIGFGHGQPPSTAFSTSASGSCLNCWVGVQFTPPATGPIGGTLTLTSSTTGSPYVLALTGSGLPLTGLLLTPVTQDFGPVPIDSESATALFALTNLVPGGSSVNLATPTVTGDFTLSNAVSGGAPCGGALAYTASCFIRVAFAPAAAGPLSGTLSVQAGSATATAALTGYGSADPGLSLSPNALVFNNVPGSESTQQAVTLSNSGAASVQIGTPTATTASSSASSFSASGCNTALAPGAICSISVTFTPATASATGTLTIPVTTTVGGAPVLTNYTVPLTGAYTTEDAGLQIVANDAEYGPQATGTTGVTRQFTINNLTAKQLTLDLALPRQFVLGGAPCAGLAPFASCNFSVAFLPLDNGDLTGTLFATATPTDGSATLNGLGYVEGYGVGAGTLAISGTLQPGDVLNFGQVPSGQSAQQTLTLTNASATAPLTIRRVTSEWPFLSTTTCGATLAPAASYTVTLSYTPINQVAAGSNPPVSTADSGELVVESDAASSPDLIDLTGTSTPVAVATPTNIPPLATLTPSQSSLAFANTMVGNVSAPQTVTLVNTGTATLTVSGIQASPDYTVSASGCASIVPAASCTLTVTFTPQSATQQGSGNGQRVSAIEISSNATTSLEFISLVGVSSPSALALGASSLNFGSVLVGANSTQTLQLTDTGTSAVTFGSISAATTLTAASGDYSTALGNCPQPGQTLAPGTSCTLQLAFAPTQPGTIAGTLSIASSASTLPLTVSLTGIGEQSHMQILPASLNFGPIAVGSPASLSLTLANNGSAPIAGIALAATGDYAVTVPCAVATLAPGGSCGVTVTFTPTVTGADNSTLTVTSSDATSPDSVPLTGSGISNGSFTLTVGGGASASATVASGTPAPYNLTITPVGGFSGTVVLNCTPVAAAQFATCSLLPSSVTLSGTAQNAVATLNTVTEIASNSSPAMPVNNRRSFGGTALCLLFPALIFTWKARTSRHRAWRQVGPVAWAIFSAAMLLSSSGCGGATASSNLRFSPSGAYRYQVTASSVSGGTQITQTVTLNLTVQ